MGPAAHQHEGTDDQDHGTGEIGELVDPGGKAFEPFRGLSGAPGGEDADGDENGGEAEAEGADHRHAEGELIDVEACQENDDGGGARQQAAGKTEHGDLSRCYAAVLKSLSDLLGMKPRVSVVGFHVVMRVVMVVVMRVAIVMMVAFVLVMMMMMVMVVFARRTWG